MAQPKSALTEPTNAPSDEWPQFTYSNGVLSASSVLQLHDEDIVAVSGAEAKEEGFQILSLAKVEGAPDAISKPPPFELLITKAANLPEEFLSKYLIEDLPIHLQPSHELQVIISKLSGTGLATGFFDEILKPVLQTFSIDESRYTVVRTETSKSVLDHAKDSLLRSANGGINQTVVVLSGDGGVVDIINGLT